MKERARLLNSLPNHLRAEVKKIEEIVARVEGYAVDGSATPKQLDTFWSMIAKDLLATISGDN